MRPIPTLPNAWYLFCGLRSRIGSFDRHNSSIYYSDPSASGSSDSTGFHQPSSFLFHRAIQVNLFVTFILSIIIWPVLCGIYVDQVSVIYHTTQLHTVLFTFYGIIFGAVLITLSLMLNEGKSGKQQTYASTRDFKRIISLLISVLILTLYLMFLNFLDYFMPIRIVQLFVLWLQIAAIPAFFFLILTLLS